MTQPQRDQGPHHHVETAADWRSFRLSVYSVHPLMFPSTSPRQVLLACPHSPPWNLLSLLWSACCRSDPPFSRQGTALAHLDSLSLTIWCSGLTVLFLFLLAKVALANCSLCGIEVTLFFSADRVCSSSLLKPAPFCKLFAGLGTTNKSAISLLFPYYLTLVLSSPPYPLLHLSFYLYLSGSNFLLSPLVPQGYNGFPGHSFLLGNDTADELARRVALLAPSAISCSLSPLISRIHFLSFLEVKANCLIEIL